MQNNICIIGVKLNVHKVFFSHKFTRRDICATHQLSHRWCFAWNDARYRSTAASVHHRHHHLFVSGTWPIANLKREKINTIKNIENTKNTFARPAAGFLPYFCSQPGSDLRCWVAKCLGKWTQVSRFRRLIVPRAWWTGTLPCWKIKNTLHAWETVAFELKAPYGSMRYWSSPQHIKIRSISNHSPQIGHTHGHHYWLCEGQTCLQQPVSFLSHPAHRRNFLRIFGHGCINQKC